MLNALLAYTVTLRIRAAIHHFTIRPRKRFSAAWTFLREVKSFCSILTKFREHGNDFGNNIARFLDDDGVADPHIEPLNLILIMESGSRDRRSRELHRREERHGSDGSGTADLELDVENLCCRLRGLEFV